MDISLLTICPKCKKHLMLTIESENIHINCQCGYDNTHNIKEGISIANNYKNINENINQFSTLLNKINEGYLHLLSYFQSLKNEHINQLKYLINQIESSYEQSIQRNNSILSLLQILIYNYDGSSEMKKSIVRNHINIYKCDNSNKPENVIKYFNQYNINKKENGSEIINDLKTINIIEKHTLQVTSLLLLKNKKIASCSTDKTIRVYDPDNGYKCDEVLNRHSNSIVSICELDNGTIVSCSWDKSIIIGDSIIKNAHTNCINKVITLPNNRIASCAGQTIKIWKSVPPYNENDSLIKILQGHLKWVVSLLYIKDRDILLSVSLDNSLRLWNMSTYQCYKIIDGVEISWNNSLYQIDNDRVIIGGKNKFSIINIDKCVIEKTIEDNVFENVRCFLKLRDNNTILCGCDNGLFCFYNMNKEEYRTTINNHNKSISDLLQIDDSTFLSCSFDGTIKIWNY